MLLITDTSEKISDHTLSVAKTFKPLISLSTTLKAALYDHSKTKYFFIILVTLTNVFFLTIFAK